MPDITRPSRGFTLLELLMVVLLVGIISGIAMLGFNPGGLDRQMKEESVRLAVVMEQAANEAVMQNRELGLQLQGDSYRFLCLNEEKQHWDECVDKLFKTHTLPVGIQIRVLKERQQTMTLSEDLTKTDSDILKRQQPDIYFLSSGEASPASIELEAEENNSLRQVLVVDELGRIRNEIDDIAGEGGDEQ